MQQPPEITFTGLDHSDALEDYIRDKIEELERFHPRITSCRVAVSTPHRSPAGTFAPLAVAVEIDVPGHKLITVKDVERPDDPGGERTAMINRLFHAVQRRLQAAAQKLRQDVKVHEGELDTGQVVRVFPEQNYGFVQLGTSSELYFTRNAVVDDRFDELEPGTLVQVTPATTEGPMGPQASSVRVLNARRSPEA